MKWLLLFSGGGLGAMLRFALSGLVDQRMASAVPWGTLAVNALGCLAIGALVTTADLRGGVPPGVRLFLVAGVLGGFTTFSAFGFETWQLVEDGRAALAALYAGGSVLAGIAGVVVGVLVGRALGS